MSTYAERTLALSYAEDGELQEADEALTKLIARLEGASARGDANASADLARLLCDRANVRAWAVRHAESLRDLDRAEALAEGLKPLNRQALRLSIFDARIPMLGAPFSPLRDDARADAELAKMRSEIASPTSAWMADAVETRLAQHRRNWHRVAELSPSVIAAFEGLGLVRGVLSVRNVYARALLQEGRNAEALPHAEAAYAFFRDPGPPDIAAQAAVSLARALGPSDRAWALVDEALGRVESLVRAQRSIFDQQRYLVDKIRVYEDALRLAFGAIATAASPRERETTVRRAWEIAERAKSFSLRHAMTQGGWLRAIDPEQAGALQQLDERLDALEAQTGRSEESYALQASLLAERHELLQASMRKSPIAAQVVAPAPFDLGETLRRVGQGMAVVSWYWLEASDGWALHVLYAGSDRVVRHHSTRWTTGEIQALVSAQRRTATVEPFRIGQLIDASIGDRLLPSEVLTAIADCHTIVASPHGVLQQLPLHAMQLSGWPGGGSSNGWLLERHALQLLPTFALPFSESLQPSATSAVLLLGSTQDGFGHPPLPQVVDELEVAAQAWERRGASVRRHVLAAGERIAPVAALETWPTFDVIHLACHGVFDASSPLDATLYLGRDSIRATDFFEVELRARLVALSACDVGQHAASVDGMALVSSEWLGLALPLFQSGARTLLTSMWKAQSEAAYEFMKALHLALAEGVDPARAFQRACRQMIDDEWDYGMWANWQLAGFPA